MSERAMTCEDVAPLLDAFVDAELEGATLVEVARHAAACQACDAALQDLIALHEAIGRHGRADAESVDLSGLWPVLAPELERADAQRAWRRRLRSTPVWSGVGLALAASALFFLTGQERTPPPQRIVYRPNQAVIERIDTTGGRFELRRERKNGTTLIMVSATGDDLP
jgi:anti-sigma factor RsiW